MITDIDKKTSYINLKIGTENFAISVYQVLEIIQFDKITRIPDTSAYVPGVINFRGSIVPVIDMNKRFKIENEELAEKMVVIVEINSNEKKVLMGLIVDQVTDVIEFEYKEVKSVPDLGIKYNPEFLDGFVEREGRFIMVMNTDHVLSVNELSEITEKAVV
jgi:purine-binding chemotaxis protein CheW